MVPCRPVERRDCGKERNQGSGSKDLSKGRTLMMMMMMKGSGAKDLPDGKILMMMMLLFNKTY